MLICTRTRKAIGSKTICSKHIDALVFACCGNALTVKCACTFAETPHKKFNTLAYVLPLTLYIKMESWMELLQIGRFHSDVGGKKTC